MKLKCFLYRWQDYTVPVRLEADIANCIYTKVFSVVGHFCHISQLFLPADKQ